MGGRYGRTDFSGYTQAQLVQMLTAGRTTDVQAAADGWRDLANALDDVALTIERQDADFRGLWQGPSAAEHAAMIASLVDGVRRVAFFARSVGSQVSTACEALGRAQQRMAALGPPPTVAPLNQATIALASAPLPYGRPELPVAAAQQAAAIRAVQDYQRAQASATALNAAAAAILSDLRDQYDNLNFPTLPQVANPPTIAPDGTPIFSTQAGPGGAAGARTAAYQPLFSDLWGDGLAAAAGLPPAQVLAPYQPAAAGGAGQPGQPISGGAGQPFSGGAGQPFSGGAGQPFSGGALAGSAVGSGLGSLGSSAVGAAGSVGAFAAPSLDPSAVPSAVGQSSLAPMIDPASAAGRATGTAAVPGFLGGGFSPLGGAGGLGGGIGGGGVAAWLVGEVEEFGVKATVVPGLID